MEESEVGFDVRFGERWLVLYLIRFGGIRGMNQRQFRAIKRAKLHLASSHEPNEYDMVNVSEFSSPSSLSLVAYGRGGEERVKSFAKETNKVDQLSSIVCIIAH